MTEITPSPVSADTALIIPSPDLHGRHAADYQALAKTKRLARNTVKTSGTAQRMWVEWCAASSYEPTQITPPRLVVFAGDLARAGKTHNTIKTYLSLLGSEAKRITGTNPRLHPDVVQAVANTAYIVGTHEEKANPITLVMLRDIVDALAHTDDQTRAVRLKAMCCIAYYSALRGSNLIELKLSNIAFRRMPIEGRNIEVVTLTIERGKTDQTGEGREITIPATNTPTCPVRALKAWMAIHPFRSQADAPLFLGYRGKTPLGMMGLWGWSLATREVCNLAGLPVENISSHSWRAGRATDLVAAGVPDTFGMKVTGHKNEAVYHGYDRTAESDAQVMAAMKVEVQYREGNHAN